MSANSDRVEVAEAYGNSLSYRACSGCGLVRLDPRPTDESISRFYESFYMGGERDIASARTKQRDFAHFLLATIVSHVRLDRVHAVLDLGCGYGETLAVIGKALANYHRVTLHGIEPSKDAREIAQHTCELVGQSHADLATSDMQYDLIMMSHVLEHMADPVGILRLLASKLTANGSIALEVPNYYCHPSTDLVHNYLFTPASLTNTLSAAGLYVVEMVCSDHASSFRPAYLTALVRPGAGRSVVKESVGEVLAARRAALKKWPGFTRPAGVRQFAKRLVGRVAIG